MSGGERTWHRVEGLGFRVQCGRRGHRAPSGFKVESTAASSHAAAYEDPVATTRVLLRNARLGQKVSPPWR